MRVSPLFLALGLCLATAIPSAQAEPRANARGQAAKKPAKPSKPVKPSEAQEEEAPQPTEGEEVGGAGESGVKAAGTGPKAAASATVKGVKEEENASGVKTYEFGAVEVEGRLRSPQILYFLRRVRAEFDARGLGHRSFLLELADTRNDAAFR